MLFFSPSSTHECMSTRHRRTVKDKKKHINSTHPVVSRSYSVPPSLIVRMTLQEEINLLNILPSVDNTRSLRSCMLLAFILSFIPSLLLRIYTDTHLFVFDSVNNKRKLTFVRTRLWLIQKNIYRSEFYSRRLRPKTLSYVLLVLLRGTNMAGS